MSAQINLRGFTLVELLIAISIVVVIATVGIVTYSSTQRISRISKRAQDLQAIANAIELYKVSTGHYPIQATGNCVGTNLGSVTPAFTPTYMPTIPADPLDAGNASGTNCYRYRSDGTGLEYKLYTNASITGGSLPEMSTSDFKQQPSLIDPARDGGAVADCIVDTSSNTITAWAIYSGPNACAY